MSDNKKASEVILEIKEQVSFLTKLVASQDNNIKLILKKLNSLEAQPVKKTISNKNIENTASPISSPVVENKFLSGSDAIAAKIKHAEEQNANSAFERAAMQAGIDIDSIPERPGLSEAKTFSGQMRGRRVDRESKDSPISITQLVTDEFGKPLAIASIQITDKLGNPVKSTRSNTKGRWTIPLMPGDYNVHILKKYEDKKPVEFRFPLSVRDNGTGKMEVPFSGAEGLE